MFCDVASVLKSREHLGYDPDCSETVGEGGQVGRLLGGLNQN